MHAGDAATPNRPDRCSGLTLLVCQVLPVEDSIRNIGFVGADIMYAITHTELISVFNLDTVRHCTCSPYSTLHTPHSRLICC
jgi:hypothetical protein